MIGVGESRTYFNAQRTSTHAPPGASNARCFSAVSFGRSLDFTVYDGDRISSVRNARELVRACYAGHAKLLTICEWLHLPARRPNVLGLRPDQAVVLELLNDVRGPA